MAGPEIKHKRFANGDTYSGGWKNGMPSGEGKYTWADGSVYTGSWKDGAKHGVGTYCWPSGASYHGEWQAGYMHGVGSFESPDGSRYSGGWRKDVKHGLGKKTYANGDSYEGLWDNGRPNGPGRYVWADGNEYDGEWRCGKMDGEGTFVWSTGERYDGGWKDGREHGLGLFTFPDGSTYRGFWEEGRKHGVGVQRPPPWGGTAAGAASSGGTAPADGRLHHAGSDGDGATAGAPIVTAVNSGGTASSGHDAHAAAAVDAVASTGNGAGGGSPRTGGGGRPGSAGAHDGADGAAGGGPAAGRAAARAGWTLPPGVALVKEYEHGRLVRQSLLQATEAAAVLGKPDRLRRVAGFRRADRQPKKTTRLGQVVYKENSSYDLMVGLQAGIRWSATRALPQAEQLADGGPPPGGPRRRLPDSAFAEKLVVPFPRGGSVDTPVHRASSDFEWRDYCPAVFRNLREAFGWEPSLLVQQLCSDHALRLLNSPGKSGSVFFLSADDQLLVKTIRKAEAHLLLELLPRYHNHMLSHPNSLLVRVLGLFSITSASSGGRKVRFVVMNNLFNTPLQIHERYDLKGSTLGRTAGPGALEKARTGDPSIVLKDLDLGSTAFKLEAQWHERLMEQLAADCALLEECGVMDYSLLLGLHDRSRGNDGGPATAALSSGEGGRGGGGTSGGEDGTLGGATGGGGADRLLGGMTSDEPWSGDEGPAAAGAALVAAAHSGGGTGPAAVNFQEYRADEGGLRRRLARVQARIDAIPGLSPEARLGLLQLARVEMLSSGAARRQQAQRPAASTAAAAAALRNTSTVVATRPKRSNTLRPLSMSAGSTDALALSLGQSRVQLGAAMAATSVPDGTAAAARTVAVASGGSGGDGGSVDGEEAAAAVGSGGGAADGAPAGADSAAGTRDLVLFFGIIDIFTVYGTTKRLEHVIKSLGSSGASVAPPKEYSQRFQRFLRRVFV